MSADSFYRKQPVSKRSNRRDQVTVIDAEGRRNQTTNPDPEADQYLRKNIKLFSILIICMGALLVLSIKYVEYQWGRRDRSLTGTYQSQSEQSMAVLSTNTPSVTDLFPAEMRTPVMEQKRERAIDAEVETILRWGMILEEANELEGAIDRYNEALMIDPDNVTVLTRAGRLNIRLSRYQEAVEVLSAAKDHAESNPDILNDLGVALTFNGQMEEAVRLYDDLLKDHPAYTPAFFNQGYAYMQLEKFDQALPLLETYIAKKPGDTMALGVLAVLELNKKNHLKAISYLDRAIEIDPTWPMPYLDAATIYASIGDHDLAVDYLSRSLEYSDPAEVYQRYQSSAFEDLRLTERGKKLEEQIAEQARKRMN